MLQVRCLRLGSRSCSKLCVDLLVIAGLEGGKRTIEPGGSILREGLGVCAGSKAEQRVEKLLAGGGEGRDVRSGVCGHPAVAGDVLDKAAHLRDTLRKVGLRLGGAGGV